MQQALAEFLRHLGLEKNASAHTVKSYREDLNQALEFFRGKLGSEAPRPEQLSTRLLRAYLAWLHEQGYARSTIARRLAAVRWCCGRSPARAARRGKRAAAACSTARAAALRCPVCRERTPG